MRAKCGRYPVLPYCGDEVSITGGGGGTWMEKMGVPHGFEMSTIAPWGVSVIACIAIAMGHMCMCVYIIAVGSIRWREYFLICSLD